MVLECELNDKAPLTKNFFEIFFIKLNKFINIMEVMNKA